MINQNESGELNYGPIRHGVTYKGRFFEFGTVEFNNLMLMEGKSPENKDTLLGIFSEATKIDDISNTN